MEEKGQASEGAQGALSWVPDGVSAGAFPLFPVGALNPVSASHGTNDFLPIGGGVHLNPVSNGSPRLLGAGHPALPNNCCEQLASRPTLPWAPVAWLFPCFAGLCSQLSYKRGWQHNGGDFPGTHSHNNGMSISVLAQCAFLWGQRDQEPWAFSC